MPTTKNYGFPLYDPEDIPDLTPTGREAEAVIAIDKALKNEEDERTAGDAELNAGLEKETTERKAADKTLTDNLAKEVADRKAADTALGGRIDAEVTAREAADTALGVRIDGEVSARIEGDANLSSTLNQEIADRKAADTALGKRIDTERANREAITGDIVKQLTKETADRKAADTALGKRIDNAETEISANSADLTGIKGLTYGDNHVAFLENSNGEYDSPALQEIEEQIAAGKLNVAIYGTTTFKEVQAMLPNVVCKRGTEVSQLSYVDKNVIHFFRLGFGANHELLWVTDKNEWSRITATTDWNSVKNKPFNTVGSGLNTASATLSLDTSYLPTVSAGSGVTVTPTTDGNHTKYEISAAGGTGGTGGTTTVSAGVGINVTPTADGDGTKYTVAVNPATKTNRGGVQIGSGLNVDPSGIISVDTSTLPTLVPSDGILIDKSISGDRTLYTVQAKADEKTIGFNDDGELTALSTGSGGITGNTTWSEMES